MVTLRLALTDFLSLPHDRSLLFKIRSYAPCAICGVKTRTSVASETMVRYSHNSRLTTHVLTHSHSVPLTCL